MIQFFKQLGFEASLFLAGMSGAFVFLTANQKMNKMQRFLTILSGGLSANYLTPLVANWVNLGNSVIYGISFLLGYSGLKTVEFIIQNIKRK